MRQHMAACWFLWIGYEHAATSISNHLVGEVHYNIEFLGNLGKAGQHLC